MRVLRVLGVLVGLVFAAAAIRVVTNGGGSSTTVVNVGGQEVTIPEGTPRSAIGITRAVLKQTAYEPWYQACVLSQAEKNLSPKIAREFAQLPTSKLREIGLELMHKSLPVCEASRGARNIVNPTASHSELALLELQTAKTMELLLAHEKGVTPRLQHCVVREVEGMRDAEAIELANGNESVQEAIFEELLQPCAV